MSDESKQPNTDAKAEAKPAAAAAAAKPAAAATLEPPAPPEPGPFGKILARAKQPYEPLAADATGKETIKVAAKDLLKVGEFLRDDKDCRFDFLVTVTGVDRSTHREAVYHLYSTETHNYLVVKVDAENDHIPSLMPVWPATDWHERETYDLMGIVFDGHPDLRRILMPSDWLGHPLRKDYKVDDPRLVWNER